MQKDENIKMSDFDEYLRQGEPGRREKVYAWKTAIGLQAVDGLKPSAFLLEKAKQHIEGTATIDDVQKEVRSYYRQKTVRVPDKEATEEADKVSVNIARLLGSQTLAFSVFGYCQVHRNIFDGVFKFAGQIRDYDITKKEWVLRGDSVRYMYAADLRLALEHDLEQERQFSYKGLATDEIIRHICKFVADLWQIHAFPEGNTRTTAVFTIQYLRSLGFDVNNDIFSENAWYFRNALVRYVYKNNEGIQPEPKYLERFFRNLLLGEENVLRNRYLIINPPDEWKEADTPQVANKYPTSTPQVALKLPTSSSKHRNLFHTDNKNILCLVKAMGDVEWKVADIMTAMKLKDRHSFLDVYLTPAIQEGFVRMLYPDSPHHPRQRYLLTAKGEGVLQFR